MQVSEYSQLDATSLAALIRAGDISASEALDAAIAAAEQVNPQLNAIIRPMHEQARATLSNQSSKAPFYGVPFLTKDLLADYAGVVTASGCRFLQNYVPTQDAALVSRFKQAGLQIFGKTNTPEFGCVPITDPLLYGSTLNPWNTQFSPGGSSGGSGAAVASGMAPMASGGDGGGSIRVPASCCGLVGHKPSRGLNPTGPARGELWFGMTAEHVLTRSVRDSAAMLDATSGGDAGPASQLPRSKALKASQRPPKKLRIAFSTQATFGRDMHPDCIAAVQDAAHKLQALGHEVVEDKPTIDREAGIFAFLVLIAADTAQLIKAAGQTIGRKPRRQDFEPATWALKQLGEAFSAAELAAAYQHIHALGREMGRFHEQYDVYLTSTLGTPPPLPGSLRATGIDKLSLSAVNHLPLGALSKQRALVINTAAPVYDFMSETPLANATGQPSMSLPLYWNSAGLPIGVCFNAAFGCDELLYSLAGQLEQAHPWADQRASVYAG